MRYRIRSRSPSALDPLVEVRPLVAHGRIEAVAREHERLGWQREQTPVDRLDDLIEAGAFGRRVAGTAGKERVATQHHGVTDEAEAGGPARVAGRVDRPQRQ